MNKIDYKYRIYNICENFTYQQYNNDIKYIIYNIFQFFNLTAPVNIIFVNKIQMLYFNNLYKKKNTITNVLSFSNLSYYINNRTMFFLFEMPLGEIIICTEIVFHCTNYKYNKNYLCKILIHGILHILGFHHNNDINYCLMNHLEIFFLKNKYRI